MADIIVSERLKSRDKTIGDNPAYELLYNVRGTDDVEVAELQILAVAPIVYQDLERQAVHFSYLGGNLFEVSVSYGRQKKPDTNESSLSFTTSGATQHITQSLQNMGNYAPAGKTAPDYKGAIGVTDSGVEGCDIIMPTLEFGETHYLPSANVTFAYVKTLSQLTGTVNNAAYRGFAAGEILFKGCRGAKRGKADWEISFEFAMSPNLVNLAVGDITVPSKLGWYYLWVRYGEVADDYSKTLIKVPLSAHVEKVYHEKDYALLGIGTAA